MITNSFYSTKLVLNRNLSEVQLQCSAIESTAIGSSVKSNLILVIELFGELAALISLSIGPNDRHPLANAEGVQVTLVAGAGFEPATFRL